MLTDLDPPCRLCQYNLRGLSADALCPECGTPVRLSIQGDRLRNSNPVYVRTLRRGALCVLGSMTASIAIIFLSLSFLRSFRGTLPFTLIGLANSVFNCYAYWTLTSPDPSGLGEGDYGRSRRFTRFVAVVGLANILFSIPTKSIALPPVWAVAMACVRGSIDLLNAMQRFALLTYLSKLAARLPDDPIARRARRLRYTFGTLTAAMAAAEAVSAIALVTIGGAARVHLLQILARSLAILAVPGMIFGLMYVVMLGKLARRLRITAGEAEAVWDAAAASA